MTSKDIGYAKYFIGIKTACSFNGSYNNQHKYTFDILKDAEVLGAKHVVSSFSKVVNLLLIILSC